MSTEEEAIEPAAQTMLEPSTSRPRVRWGAILWGLVVTAIATVTLSVTRTEGTREDFGLWLGELTPAGIWLIVVMAAGGILLLLGLLAAIRRAQRAA
ncbi:hypothetical protein [Parafrigoribacterium soli]|uniref:hypothetical protein n=1 Tax=Parafrigoribacterium soli TaxID=3144663 RepID=UPI0032ECEC35